MSDTKPTSRFVDGGIAWRIHVPNLLNEIFCNPGTGMLTKPIQILGNILHELAELAVEIDDPRLHLMMIDLALYEVGDLNITPSEEYNRVRSEIVRQCEALKNDNQETDAG